MSLRHVHLRKRRHPALEPYPARNSMKRWLDRLILMVGVIGPAMIVPQIMLIYTEKNASGVSAISWLAWALLDIPWIIYGLVHREPPIVMTYFLWFLGNLLVFFGAVLYG